MFNSANGKLISFSSIRESPTPRVEFMNGISDVHVHVVLYDKHLVNYIGNINQNDVASHTLNAFLCTVEITFYMYTYILNVLFI